MAATAQQILDAINDALLAWAQGGIEKTVKVYGREWTYMDMAELTVLRDKLQKEVAISGSVPKLGIKLFGARFGKPK